MRKFGIEITYGIFCGLAMSAWILIEFFLGFHTTSLEIGQYSGFFSFLVPVIFIFVALRKKQLQTNGRLSINDGINVGFQIALFSSIIFAVFLYFYNHHINPDWIERMVEWQRKNLILNGASDDEIGRFTEQNRYRNSVIAQGIMNLVNSTGIGVGITVIEISAIKFFQKKY